MACNPKGQQSASKSGGRRVPITWDFSACHTPAVSRWCHDMSRRAEGGHCPLRQAVYHRLLTVCGVQRSAPDPQVDADGPEASGGGGGGAVGGGGGGEAGRKAKIESRFHARASSTVAKIRSPSEGFVFLSRLSDSEAEFRGLVAVLLSRKFSMANASLEKRIGGGYFDWRPSLANIAIESGAGGLTAIAPPAQEALHLLMCFRADLRSRALEDGMYHGGGLSALLGEAEVPGSIGLDGPQVSLLSDEEAPGYDGSWHCSICNV